MTQPLASFIDQLTRLSPALKAAHGAAMRDPAVDEPSAALAMLALGHRLADDVGGMDDETRATLFDAIEQALTDDDAALSAAAEKLIQAMVGRAVDRETWPELRPMFRDRSAEQALACMALDR